MKASLGSLVGSLNVFLFSSNRPNRLLWGAALLALPVTSFRYFPLAGDTTYMRPLAFYPLVILLPLLLVQGLRGGTRIKWPGALIPLTVFILIAIAATGLGTLLAPLELRGQDYLGRVLRAWVTLIIGLSFFLAAAWMNHNEEDLRFTIKWLLAGFILDVLWCGLQAFVFYTPFLEKETVTHWQLVFSMRELVRTNRISGMAYEPSWLAAQIYTLYLPWLFASLMSGINTTRFRWLEPVLLLSSFVILLATYSRGGLFFSVGAAVLTLIFAGRDLVKKAWSWFTAGLRRGSRQFREWSLAAGLRAGILMLVAGMMIGAYIFVNQKGYISRLWNTQAESLQEFIIENSVGARAAYVSGALGAYQRNPWMGVGLGASGFYIYRNLPDWALTMVPEIARQLNPENRLYPNPKNLYVRLLAETGLAGLFAFLAFQFTLLGEVVLAIRQKTRIWKFLGAAGLFTWFAVSFSNFTQDSFTNPNIWLNFGILAGTASFALQSNKTSRETP